MAKGRKTGGGKRGPAKLSANLKEMILKALDTEGGVEYLQGLARNQPVAFSSLLGRILPMQMTGADGGPQELVIRWQTSPDG